LADLALAGVGLTQASVLSQVPRSTLQEIRNGTRDRLPPALAATILAIPPRPAAGALTKAWPTRRLLAWFRLEGFTQADVARRLGLRTPHLQVARSLCCTVRTAARVRALYRRVTEV